MAKSKNHATHNQLQTRHRNGTKKPQSQKYESLRGRELKFLKNMRFAEKHSKKRPKKTQANNAKTMSARVEAFKALVKPNIPKTGSHKFNQLACTAHPKLGRHARALVAKGLRLCWPKSEAETQTEAQAAAVTPAPAPAVARVPIGAARHEVSSVEASVCQSEDGRTKCDPWASVCMGLVPTGKPRVPCWALASGDLRAPGRMAELPSGRIGTV
ncbi:60S ribosomal protein L29-like [Panthera leo]|uniref:60S ribosomal protein L29-like n=1 Tax=Panthera leo TaxID=9689 RepID=UPI001C6A2968|nr:60S ribosomal protein L29-like [Panthera leo]